MPHYHSFRLMKTVNDLLCVLFSQVLRCQPIQKLHISFTNLSPLWKLCILNDKKYWYMIFYDKFNSYRPKAFATSVWLTRQWIWIQEDMGINIWVYIWRFGFKIPNVIFFFSILLLSSLSVKLRSIPDLHSVCSFWVACPPLLQFIQTSRCQFIGVLWIALVNTLSQCTVLSPVMYLWLQRYCCLISFEKIAQDKMNWNLVIGLLCRPNHQNKSIYILDRDQDSYTSNIQNIFFCDCAWGLPDLGANLLQQCFLLCNCLTTRSTKACLSQGPVTRWCSEDSD